MSAFGWVEKGRVLAAMLLLSAAAAASGEGPPLWGYGIQSCERYVQARAGKEVGEPDATGEYWRYQDWLSGFVSGLNMATGQDVLRGAEIKTALRRIHLYCADHPKEDFFTATMDLVRLLSMLK